MADRFGAELAGVKQYVIDRSTQLVVRQAFSDLACPLDALAQFTVRSIELSRRCTLIS